jgi:hydroxymethylbilane synthase
MTRLIRIGTRASKLARAQAQMVQDALAATDPTLTFETVAMTTAGDRELHKQLTDWGYKGLFTKELEDDLLAGSIDIAVHSMKDMPSVLPEGLIIAGMLERADARDAWVSPYHASIRALPQGAIVGTSSARRTAQLLHQRPDIQVVPFRGNVETRLRKLEEGVATGTFLAAAGLNRLGLSEHIRALIPTQDLLPAVAQGAVGIECRENNETMRELVARISHTPTMICLAAERAFLEVLDGSCRTPIAGLATLLEDGCLELRGEVLSLDGKVRHFSAKTSSADDPVLLGKDVGHHLRRRAGEALLQHG